MMNQQIAAIPFLDLQGPQFLTFYIVALAIAVVWSFRRRKTVIAAFDAHTDPPDLTDPYEIAFLAGGVPRVSQLAVTRLLAASAVQLKRSVMSGSSLIVNVPRPIGITHEIEQEVYSHVLASGAKGLPLREVGKLVYARAQGIESRLATLGLRPTFQERSGLPVRISYPLVILLVIGGLKLLIGITRDKPVLFLVLLMFATLMLVFLVAANLQHLTPTGERLLRRLRENFQPPISGGTNDFSMIALGVALMGPSILAGYGELGFLDLTARKELQGMSAANASSSSGGCSSGCGGDSGGGGCGGGDGGGGSGCGGCGGGGGD